MKLYVRKTSISCTACLLLHFATERAATLDTKSSNPPIDESKVELTSAATPAVVSKERTQFHALLLGNPNYFGTLKESQFKPVLQLQGDTEFEQLECIGFNPQLNLLEGVVRIKQNAGYGGDICSAGTQEYVRFYVDWNNNGTWADQGMINFTVHDLPGAKPLEYAVSLSITPQKKFCIFDNLPNVRAILSWNNPPPAGNPSFIPVWGNVLEGHIQIEPLKLILFSDLLKEANIKLPDKFTSIVDLSQPIAAAKPQMLEIAERVAAYKDKNVPSHRFAFKEFQQMIAQPALSAALLKDDPQGLAKELGIDLAAVISQLLGTDGNTSYEQLTCIGLNPNQNVLEGIINVKLPNGYSGAPCASGSYEYVAFWIDYGNGYTYVGTTAVNVHDYTSIPTGGLQYAVYLPVDFSKVQQPCQNGPKIVKMRAILSWEVAPPPNNPNYVPVWGNQLNTQIQVTPGIVVEGNVPYIDSVGDMAVCDIDQQTGLATGSMIIAGSNAFQAPFGGEVTITGFITNPPNVLAGAAPIKYKVYVSEGGGGWQPLTNSFTVDYIKQNGAPIPFQVTNYSQSIDADGYYTYLEQNYPSQWLNVSGHVLAKWHTSVAMTKLWGIKIEAKLPDGTIVPTGAFTCTDGSSRSSVNIYLDQLAPSASVVITGYSRVGSPVQPAESCGKFQVGDVIHGIYSTFDAESHFNSFSLGVLPSGNAISPAGGFYPMPSVSTNGAAGIWTLDTTGMKPCGYVVQLVVHDRTIVNSSTTNWQNSNSTGFCLDPAPVITIPKL